jgi:hypothetical protein
MTSIKELEMVRSPFYDLAKAEALKDGPEAQKHLSYLHTKLHMINDSLNLLQGPDPSPESVAFTRYADRVGDENLQPIFQQPRGQSHKSLNAAELWKVQKAE